MQSFYMILQFTITKFRNNDLKYYHVWKLYYEERRSKSLNQVSDLNRRKDIIRNTLNRKARKELNLGNRMSHMVRLTPDPIITKKERTVGSILSSHLSVSIITFSYFISSKFEVPTTIVSFYFVFFFLIKVSFYFVGCSLSPLKYFFS